MPTMYIYFTYRSSISYPHVTCSEENVLQRQTDLGGEQPISSLQIESSYSQLASDTFLKLMYNVLTIVASSRIESLPLGRHCHRNVRIFLGN